MKQANLSQLAHNLIHTNMFTQVETFPFSIDKLAALEALKQEVTQVSLPETLLEHFRGTCLSVLKLLSCMLESRIGLLEHYLKM